MNFKGLWIWFVALVIVTTPLNLNAQTDESVHVIPETIDKPEIKIIGPSIVDPDKLPPDMKIPSIEKEVPITYEDREKFLELKRKLNSGQVPPLPDTPRPNILPPPRPENQEHSSSLETIQVPDFANYKENRISITQRIAHGNDYEKNLKFLITTNSGKSLAKRIPFIPGKLRLVAVTSNFDGISNTGIGVPDPIIAAGPSNLILMVNSSVAVYSKGGTNLLQRTLSDWFSDKGSPTNPLSDQLFDPWTIYDPISNRFFLIAAGRTNSTKETSLYISVSRSSDAAGTWCNYRLKFQTTLLFVDYPKVGTDNNGVYITMYMAPTAGSTAPLHTKVLVVEKAPLINCGTFPSMTFFDPTNPGTTISALAGC